MGTALCGEIWGPVLTPPCRVGTVTGSALLQPGLRQGCTTQRAVQSGQICFFSASKILLRPWQGKPDPHKDTLKLMKLPGVLRLVLFYFESEDSCSELPYLKVKKERY